MQSPIRLMSDGAHAQSSIEVLASASKLMLGRDELGAGPMWNFDSIAAWVLTRSQIDAEAVQPPSGGKTRGWSARIRASQQSLREAPHPNMSHF